VHQGSSFESPSDWWHAMGSKWRRRERWLFPLSRKHLHSSLRHPTELLWRENISLARDCTCARTSLTQSDWTCCRISLTQCDWTCCWSLTKSDWTFTRIGLTQSYWTCCRTRLTQSDWTCCRISLTLCHWTCCRISLTQSDWTCCLIRLHVPRKI